MTTWTWPHFRAYHRATTRLTKRQIRIKFLIMLNNHKRQLCELCGNDIGTAKTVDAPGGTVHKRCHENHEGPMSFMPAVVKESIEASLAHVDLHHIAVMKALAGKVTRRMILEAADAGKEFTLTRRKLMRLFKSADECKAWLARNLCEIRCTPTMATIRRAAPDFSIQSTIFAVGGQDETRSTI
jgi:hypothetical protein